MNELVSIIVPIYNVDKYLITCIDSLINQTYSNIEIILVDDGSPDRCPMICDEYAKKDSRIKVIHKKNGGLSDARNAGLDIATGKFIFFTDSDDYLNLNCIQMLCDILNESNSDIACCKSKTVDYDSNIQYDYNNDYNIVYYDNINACKLLKPDYLGCVVWNKLYKKELFDNLRFNVGLYHEDEAIIYQLVYPANKIVMINIPLYYYRLSPNSIMRNTFSKKRLDILKAFKIREDFIKNKNKELYQLTLKDHYCLGVYTLYLAKKNKILNKVEIKNINDDLDKIYKNIDKISLKIFIAKYFKTLFIMYKKLKNFWRIRSAKR